MHNQLAVSQSRHFMLHTYAEQTSSMNEGFKINKKGICSIY